MHDFFAFIQARSTSTRFPGKVLKPIPQNSNKPILSHILERLTKVIPNDRIVLLVPRNDIALIEYAKNHNIQYFEGSEENVRERFIHAANQYNAEYVIRLTADNPFIDIEYIELLMEAFENPDIEIASFSDLPLGVGVEIFKMSSIKKEPTSGIEPRHNEHVSLHLKETNEFHFQKFIPILTEEEKEISGKIRLTVDEEMDYIVCSEIYTKLSVKNPFFGIKEILSLYRKNPELFKKNENINQVSFKINLPSTPKKRIFIWIADPIEFGSGHYERCKSLSVSLQSMGFDVTCDYNLSANKDYDLFIIDHRDIEIPDEIKQKKIILIDYFGKERYSYLPHDLLPHMLNEFEDVIHNTIFPIGIESYKSQNKEKKQVLIYAGNLDFRSSFLLDKFAIKHFSNNEIIRIGGVSWKKNQRIQTISRTNKRDFLRILSESEFFISYFGQSVMDASFLNKKILLYAISDYHELLALHFSKNSEAVYIGNVIKKKLNFTASYQKFLRKVNLDLTNEGMTILQNHILKLLSEI